LDFPTIRNLATLAISHFLHNKRKLSEFASAIRKFLG